MIYLMTMINEINTITKSKESQFRLIDEDVQIVILDDLYDCYD